MANRSLLRQARAGVIKIVTENPTIISVSRNETYVDDGFGNMVLDPTGTPDLIPLTFRISHENQGPFVKDEVPSGLSTNLGRFILCDYQNQPKINDTFASIGKSWQVMSVDPLYSFGGLKGYQARILEGKNA